METTFNEIKEKIRNEVKKIEDMRYDDKGPHLLKFHFEKILHSLSELRKATCDEEYKRSIGVTSQAVFHTTNKEVSYTESAYSAYRKKNAAKKRKDEYYEQFDSAISHLKRDVYYILNTDPKDINKL